VRQLQYPNAHTNSGKHHEDTEANVQKGLIAPAAVVGLLFVLVTYHSAWSQQQVLLVEFEDLGFGSALSYIFTYNSATGEPIGYRTTHIPQIPQGTTNSFVWSYDGARIVLQFLTTTDVIEITGYDPSIDVLFFTRYPGYWAGCFSPYIPAGIPPEFATYFCQLVGRLSLSSEGSMEDQIYERSPSAEQK
jgi:hypothetical protein